MDPDWDTIHKRLTAPWPKERTLTATKAGNKQYKYLDARDLMAFLDEVVGPQNWSAVCEVADPATCAVKCTLSIHGIPKSDFGYPNNPVARNANAEHLKEAATDAIKRAAVLWGPGRDFYVDVANDRWLAEKDERKDERKDDPKGSAKTQAVAAHVPDIGALQEEVKAAVVTVAEAEQREARDVLQLAIKNAGITTPGGWTHYTVYDLQAIKDWLAHRLTAMPV